jgi:hypothetical protein
LAQAPAAATMAAMDDPRDRSEIPSEPVDPQLHPWIELREQLRLLHAQLEYAALMLRLTHPVRPQ